MVPYRDDISDSMNHGLGGTDLSGVTHDFPLTPIDDSMCMESIISIVKASNHMGRAENLFYVPIVHVGTTLPMQAMNTQTNLIPR